MLEPLQAIVDHHMMVSSQTRGVTSARGGCLNEPRLGPLSVAVQPGPCPRPFRSTLDPIDRFLSLSYLVGVSFSQPLDHAVAKRLGILSGQEQTAGHLHRSIYG